MMKTLLKTVSSVDDMIRQKNWKQNIFEADTFASGSIFAGSGAGTSWRTDV